MPEQKKKTAKNRTEPESEADKPLDPEIDAAVADIMHYESDTISLHDDEPEETKKPQKSTYKGEPVSEAKPTNRKKVKIFLVLALIIAAVCFSVPASRFFILNSLGVRGSLRVTILDSTTGQPLKNVSVMADTEKAKTDSNGVAELQQLKLGKTAILAKRVAFASTTQEATVGLGDNSVGGIELKATGPQYTFRVTDFLSGDGVEGTEASYGQATAIADAQGDIVLTVDPKDKKLLNITISKAGYRQEQVVVSTRTNGRQNVRLVPSKKHVYVSNSSGKFDVISVDIDGANEKLLLAGTGAEQEEMVVIPHPVEDVVAMVSTRDGSTNSQGKLLQKLYIIDVKSGELNEVATSESLQILDWVGNRLIFVQNTSGTSEKSTNRYSLMSYDFKNATSKKLASSNYFNDIVIAKDTIYYAPSSAFQDKKVGFYAVQADGSSNTTLFDKEVWNIFRNQYTGLQLSVQKDWYRYNLGESEVNKMSMAPAEQKNRLYRDNPSRSKSLWLDRQKGDDVLMMLNVQSGKDKQLHKQPGLKTPLYWLNDSVVVFRVKTEQETADYALSIYGGEPFKIRDVANTGGIESWYQYQ